MRAKKHLGQHFLVNRGVIDRILDSLEAQSDERFLEIGPGPATLTRPFVARGFPLTVVEYDADMVEFLGEQDFAASLRIIHADFMDVALGDVIQSQTKVFSNLPYNVSVPITAKLLEAAPAIPLMVMMYQKEVAERIRARPGTKDYGPISVLVQTLYDVDLHFNVAAGSFRPPPKVVSQVIRLRRKVEPLIEVADLAKLTELVRTVFLQRRKTLANGLKGFGGHWSSREALLESLARCGLDKGSRPERLSPGDYVRWLRASEA